MDRNRKRLIGMIAGALALFLVALPLAADALTESVEDQEMTLHLSWGSFQGLYTGEAEEGIPQGKGSFTVTAVLDQVSGQVLYSLPAEEVEEAIEASEDEAGAADEPEPVAEATEGQPEEPEATDQPDDHSAQFWTYKGSFQAGYPEGKGTFTYEDGSKVSGYFHQGDYIGDTLTSIEDSADAVVLLDAEAEDAGFQSVEQEGTALLLLTDWQGTIQQSEAILSQVKSLDPYSRPVVVAVNGDNESLEDLALWRINRRPTALMGLIDALTAYPRVQVVVALGERELSLNPVGAQDSSILAAYLLDLSSHGYGRLSLVNTDLDFAPGSAMDDLYDNGTIQRSAQVAGITFIAMIDPLLMAREYTAPAENSKAGQVLGKEALYSPEALLDPAASMTTAIAARSSNLGDAPCVLLAHCTAAGKQGIASYYEAAGLTPHTIVASGHSLDPVNYSLVETGPLLRLQPPALGAGTDVLYLDGGTHDWLVTKRNRVIIDMYSDWHKVGAPVDHSHAFRGAY